MQYWFDPQVGIDSFPLSLTFHGTGLATFRVYSVEEGDVRVHRATEPIDFDTPTTEND